MLENLKDLGDRATPGEWPAPEHDSSDIGASEWYDIGGIAQHVWREEDAAFIVALVNAYRRGELCRASDAEHYMRLANERRDALATAVARARREALEEAARRVLEIEHESGELGIQNAQYVSDEILALRAATPPEARQTETAIKPGEWNALVGPLVARCEVAAAFGQEAVWNAKGADALGKVLKRMADVLDSLIAAPPAIGNLDGEGRSHEA